MSEITHQEARSLLNAAADQFLRSEDKLKMDGHISSCKECNEYAGHLTALEISLRRVLHSSWDHHKPVNLDAQTIINPTPSKLIWSSLFGPTSALGKTAIIVVLLLGYFVITNIFRIQNPASSNETLTMLPTPNEFLSTYAQSPTPTAQHSSTKSISQTCETFIYHVQKSDTLEKIAFQFGISQELIQEYNNLNPNTIFTGMELAIPLCSSTPSRTATNPINTITFTPITLSPTEPQ